MGNSLPRAVTIEIRQMMSLAFLLVALSLFVAFQVLPGFGEKRGWSVWPDIWEVSRNLSFLDPKTAVILASFMNFSFLIVVSPFLKNVWPKSRWAWWGAVIFSGLAGAAFWLMYFISLASGLGASSPLGLGGVCLLVASGFNFVGLLLARPKIIPSQIPVE